MGQKLSVNSYILAHSVAHPKGATARGGSGCECNEQTKGEQLGAAKCRKLFPLSLAYGLPAPPINGGAFWCGINSYIKPALKGEVGFAQAKAGGVIK